MSDRDPMKNAPQFICPRCDAFSHQEWHDLMVSDGEGLWEEFADALPPVPLPGVVSPKKKVLWSASYCVSCRQYTVWKGDSIIFPQGFSQAEAPSPRMSEGAKTLYREAAAVIHISPRASAALARAALEAELKALGVGEPKDRLDARIAALAPRVSRPLWEALTVLRDAGNSVLHSDGADGVVGLLLDGSDSGHAPFLLSMINKVVEELVEVPDRISAMYELLPEGVRDTAEKKAEQASTR